MAIEDTKEIVELHSQKDVNSYLALGWVLIGTNIVNAGEIFAPDNRVTYVVAWQQKDIAPSRPAGEVEDTASNAKSEGYGKIPRELAERALQVIRVEQILAKHGHTAEDIRKFADAGEAALGISKE
jgi:hypothetical protein